MKKLSLFLSVLMLLSCVTQAAAADFSATGTLFGILPATPVVWGDADGNGAVEGRDLLLLRSYCASVNYETGLSSVDVYTGADANGDGSIGAADIVLMRKYIADYNYVTHLSSVVLGPAYPADAVYDEATFLAMKPAGSYYIAADFALSASYAGTFTGTLDGKGHTVTVAGVPMFEDLSGTVRDFSVKGQDVSTNQNFAALARTSSKGMTAENLTNYVNVTVSGVGLSAAGLLAKGNAAAVCTFTGCVNYGTVNVVSTVSAAATDTESHAAGIVACADNVIADSCVNNGAVTAEGGNETSPLGIAGGIVARAASNAGKNTISLNYCVNNGTVYASNDAGGLVGYVGCASNLANETDSSPFTVRCCTNTGKVTGHRYAGGILGYAYGSKNAAYVSVTYNLNTGAILGGRQNNASGAAQSGYCSSIVCYSNSVYNEIAYNIGAGSIGTHGEAGTTAPAYAFISCSSVNYNADPFIHDNYVLDGSKMTYFSYSAGTTANQHNFAWGSGKYYLTRTTAAKLASGEVAYAINSAAHSNFFRQNVGTETMPNLDPNGKYVVKNGTAYQTSATAPTFAEKSMDGKKVMFIGNSMIYYGGVVVTGSQQKTDKGWFYQICQANGENCTVYDYTYGGKTLQYIYDTYMKGKTFSGFDYVFCSEAGSNCSTTWSTMQKIKACFSGDTQLVYLNHAYTVYQNHTALSNQLPTMRSNGVIIVDWGQAVYDLWQKTVTAPGATLTYNKKSFIKNNGDTHHPNPLAGYVAAMMAYSAVTGKSSIGQFPNAYNVGNSIKYGASVTGYDAYISKHYTAASDTNFKSVLASATDLRGLQMIMDRYLENWGITLTKSCAHDFVTGKLVSTDSKNGYQIYEAVCKYCGIKKQIQVPIPGATDINVMYVSSSVLKSSGYSTVKDYMMSGEGIVFYRGAVSSCNHQWGREGYSGIYGMASLCDGSLTCKQSTDATVLCWKFASGSTLYNADASTGSGAKYRALIGYEFAKPVTVDAFSLYCDATTKALTGFDILGGLKDASGKINWVVLWSGTNLNAAGDDAGEAKFTPYNSTTLMISDDLDQTATIDCVQIAVTSASASVIYISEFELIGQFVD